jgi:hypothetical protein
MTAMIIYKYLQTDGNLVVNSSKHHEHQTSNEDDSSKHEFGHSKCIVLKYNRLIMFFFFFT